MEELSAKTQLNIQKWLEIIHQCRDSGLSNQQWCEENGISLKSYYYWLARIRKMAIENLPHKRSARTVSTELSEATVFAAIPVINHCPANAAPVTIRVGSAVIEITADTPDSLIRSVILTASKC